MSYGQGPPVAIEPSTTPREGWHCGHYYYRLDRALLPQLPTAQRRDGARQLMEILDAEGPRATQRLQTFVVSGHKADLGIMLMDPDPLKIDRVHQEVMNSYLGPALLPTYSFVSISEISEYVPSVEQYAARLVDEGEVAGSEAYEAKVNAYRRREPLMRRQRLTPDFPDWPVMCFYPMNKKRKVGENWYALPFSDRSRMMNEHARSGMAFAGRVTQLITVSIGLDDWEWGVTLWAINPEFLTHIVYQMRFDEASARYGEFGPFYTGYPMSPAQVLAHLGMTID